ncbi:DUF5133 domain-containing protein [Streptomyces sp. WMMC940]|uniref:DUF5133 domain-containing protein n=1 Tax=Streptomyces sp. WMMC940 TaxID=3015153 RepID=UPI0022B733AD|nr:DUF5133 domain-containing protein [Streptomyces sp. WMMC940]MCZ7457198.1 DUF5133 domain-containing protein [Streptomyces sp. WMMC940]
MPDPKALRSLLARYADLRIAAPKNDENRRALDDVSYTLCVMTATSTVADALERADALLQGAAAAGKVPPPATGGPLPGPSKETAQPRDDSGITLVA